MTTQPYSYRLTTRQERFPATSASSASQGIQSKPRVKASKRPAVSTIYENVCFTAPPSFHAKAKQLAASVNAVLCGANCSAGPAQTRSIAKTSSAITKPIKNPRQATAMNNIKVAQETQPTSKNSKQKVRLSSEVTNTTAKTEQASATSNDDPRAKEISKKLTRYVNDSYNGNYEEAFQYFDKNGDGFIDRGELVKALKEINIGNSLTRGLWADGILKKLAGPNGKISQKQLWAAAN